MTALVASSSAEWEMVYMVSCVAMPTITALVVMLARWKGKKLPTDVPNSNLSETPANERVPNSKKRNAESRAERNERLIRRVTSCPDFAVVRVVKASGKMPRQVSFTNLKDRKLQEEIAKLADRLLNNAEQSFGEDRKGCGWDRIEMRGLRKSMPWRAKLRAEQATKVERKREAEEFCTKGSTCEERNGSEDAVAVRECAKVRPQRVEVSKVDKKVQDVLESYDRLRLDFCNLERLKTYRRSFVEPEDCSVVKYWGQSEGAIECAHNRTGDLLWSVDSQGVVESWDSRVGHMSMLSHYLTLPSGENATTRVEGLSVTGWQLRIRLASGSMIEVDGRKLLQ